VGLYLCVLDEGKNDIEGVEVGSYDDFDYFRSAVVQFVEEDKAGSVCPTLILHSDCDGVWTPEESVKLKEELGYISSIFINKRPIRFNSNWQDAIASEIGLHPSNLYESFIDVDGEFLIERLVELCDISEKMQCNIYFQ